MELSSLDLLSIALVLAMAGSVLLNKLPGPCRCEKCAFHTNDTRMTNERKRAQRHREVHAGMYFSARIPWEDPRCAQCSLGHADDKDRVDY